MTIKKPGAAEIFFIVLGIFLLFLVCREAVRIPLTHDEGNTIYCSTTPVTDIVSYKDPVPNNHILNTLFIKLNTALFGESLFIARLHNVLSLIPFFLFTVLLSYRLFSEFWLRVALVLMITCQPYLLDFFAVTRGYGLSVAFEMISLYYLLRRLEDGNTSHLVAALGWAAVGVYANFTLLNYYLPLSAMLVLHSSITFFKADRRRFVRDVVVTGFAGLMLLLVIAVPVKKMVETRQFVFWGTKGFLSDTAQPLIVSLRSAVDYFKASNEEIYGYTMAFIILTIAAGLFLSWRKKQWKPEIWFYILPALVLVYNHLQFYLLDVPFLNARTALFLVPLVCIPVAISMGRLLDSYRKFGFVWLMILNFLFVQHFLRGYRSDGTFEWYFDVNTYDVLDKVRVLVAKGEASKPASVNCYWIYYPSMSYHTEHQYSDTIKMAAWNTKIDEDQDSEFYYAERGELEKLQDRFDVIAEYGQGQRILLRRKRK